MPSRKLAEACDRVLETGGILGRLWPLVDQERQRAYAGKAAVEVTHGAYAGGWHEGAVLAPETATDAAGPNVVVVPVLTWQGKAVFMPVDRRTLLRAGIVVLPFGTSEVEWPRLTRAIHAPERVDAEIVGYLQRVLHEYDTTDRMLGPHSVIDVVTMQMGLIDRLRRDARGDVRRELLRVGAQYADFASWLYQDAGDAQAVTYWSERGMEWALESGTTCWFLTCSGGRASRPETSVTRTVPSVLRRRLSGSRSG